MKILILFCLFYLFLASSVTEIELNQQMEISDNIFHLTYTKQTEKSVILILFYENVGKCDIIVNYKYYQIDTYNETNSGFIFFPYNESEYEILFNKREELQEKILPSTFKLVSSEFEFSLDINKKIVLTGISRDIDSKPCPIVFSFENFENETYVKILEIQENEFIYISENEGDYRRVRSNLLYFKKDVDYKIKIELSEYYNKYRVNNFIMDDINSDSIKIANPTLGGNILKPNIKYFFKIISNEYDLVVKLFREYYGTIKRSLAECQNEVDFNNFPYSAQYLTFGYYYEDIIEKQEGINYYILLIEFEKEKEVYCFFTTTSIIELNEEKEFNQTNSFFALNYEKKSNISEILYVFYESDNYQRVLIQIDGSQHSLIADSNMNTNIGTINFEIEKSGEYCIFIGLMSNSKSKVKIVSSEYEFTLNINREIFFYNSSSFETFKDFNTQIKFNITNTDKAYHKFFSSENLDKVIYYNKNYTEFIPMTNPLLLFEKGETIRFIIYMKNISLIARLSNLERYFITELSCGSYEYEIPTDKIFKIDFFKTPNFKFEGIQYYHYHIAYVAEEQYKSIDNNFEKLSFHSYNNNSFSKPDNFYYAILIAEFYINGTLNIEQIENPINLLDYNSEQIFNSFKTNYQFKIPESERNKALLFIYKANEEFSLKIEGPDNYKKNEAFGKKDEIEGFALVKCENGTYNFSFSSKNRFEGKFRIIKLSQEFYMDINEKIKLNSFSIDYKPDPLVIVINTENLKEDVVYKKLTLGEENNLLSLIKIGHNGEDAYKNLNLNYYAFQKKEKEYRLKIDFKDNGNNQYEFHQFSIDDFNNYQYNDFIYGVQKYNGPIIQFMKIDFEATPKIKVKIIKDNNLIINIAYHDGEVDFKTILNDLVFEDLKDKLKDNLILSNNYSNATIMLELKQGSEIDFIDPKNNDDKEEGSTLVFILTIAIPVGIILILLIIFLICRHYKKNNEVEIKEIQEKEKEMLMPLGE